MLPLGVDYLIIHIAWMSGAVGLIGSAPHP